jgi:hypothetical protein
MSSAPLPRDPQPLLPSGGAESDHARAGSVDKQEVEPLSKDENQADILNLITKNLERFPRMTRATTVNALGSKDTNRKPRRRFLVREPNEVLKMRFAEQLDIEADAIVRDGELGSLGLIHVVPTGKLFENPSAQNSPVHAVASTHFAQGSHPYEHWLRSRVDKAAYLRHLLLEQVRPGAADSGKTAYAVELVFVFPGQPGVSASAI